MSPQWNHNPGEESPAASTDIVRTATGSALYGPTAGLGHDLFGGGGGHHAHRSSRRSAWSPQRLLRYKWTIVVVAVLLAGPAIAGVWTMMQPKYSASGQIRVRPIIQRLVYRTDLNGPIPFYESFLNTQVTTIKSPIVLNRVLEQKDVQDTKWYNEEPPFWQRNNPSKLEKLQKALNVQTVGRTEVIAVTVEAASASDAAAIANVVLNQYITFVNETSGAVSDDTFKVLAETAQGLKREIEGLRNSVETLQKSLGTTDPAELVALKRVRLDKCRADLEVLERTLNLAQWRLKEVQKNAGDANATAGAGQTKPPAPEQPGMVDFRIDQEWRSLYAAFRAAQHKVDLERGRLGDAHPTMTNLLQEVKFAEELLKAREKQLTEAWQARPTTVAPLTTSTDRTKITLEQQVKASQAEIRQLEHERDLLVKDLEKYNADWETTFDRAQTLARDLDSIRQKQERYNDVTERLDQKRMESKAPGAIRIQSYAVVPSSPTKDRRLVLTVLSALLAIGAGVVVAFLRAGADPAIYEYEDLGDASPAPFLGRLPKVTDTDDRPPLDDPFLNEGIRMVRTPLLQRLAGTRGKVVLVTSASPGDGKTTVSILLARSLAQCGKRVLLVDGDLRNPNVSKHLGLDVNTGLIESLSHDLDDSQVIVETDVSHLSVLPAGKTHESFNPELIANGVFSAAVDRWRDSYDIILLDSSPVLPVADARILAHHADGTLLVVWAERTRRTDVVETMAHLNAAGGRLWGTVFIGSSNRGGAGRGYGYGYGYGPYGENR